MARRGREIVGTLSLEGMGPAMSGGNGILSEPQWIAYTSEWIGNILPFVVFRSMTMTACVGSLPSVCWRERVTLVWVVGQDVGSSRREEGEMAESPFR